MSTNNVDNSNPCRVYVGNLDWEVTWRDLKDHMRDMGHIQRVDVVKDWDGRSRGFGFVDFSNEHDALRAITELNDTELKSRRIIVREDRNLGRKGIPTRERRIVEKLAPDGPREFGFSKVVVVGNLAPEVTWRNLKDLFRSAGAVSRADIIFDEDRVSTGVAIVEFRFGSDVNNAISQFNETFLGENIITVRPATAEDRFITGKVSGQGRRVYVGQLAWSVTWQVSHLSTHMGV